MDKSEKSLTKTCELNWYKRAQVKSCTPYEGIPFDRDKWDLLPELMPFCNHPLWKPVSESNKGLAATYGWLMYNQKTIDIETKVISPLCYSIIDGSNQLSSGLDFIRVISQTLVDESFHTLLSIEGIQSITKHRNLTPFELPKSKLLKNYENSLDHATGWEKEIVQMGVVVASEVLITDYLSLIANSETIQPLCRMVTRTHWKDELAHANVFNFIATSIISRLPLIQRHFFIESIIQAEDWFSDKEFEIWEVILKFLNIPRAEEIIADSKKAYTKNISSLANRKINTLVKHLKQEHDTNKLYSLPELQAIAN